MRRRSARRLKCPAYLPPMSIAALLSGVERHLRSAEVLNDRPTEKVGARVGVQPAPGKPPAFAGQYYISIWFGGGRGNDFNPQRSDETCPSPLP